MFTKPSLTLRIGLGKATGFLFGLAGFILTPYFVPEADILLRWGILLWYTTLGAIVGVFGVYTRHPVLKFPLPWWFRAPIVGAWLNFVLTFFVYDRFKDFMTVIFGADGLLASPFWFCAEGAIVGLVIGWVATHFGSEGEETAGN